MKSVDSKFCTAACYEISTCGTCSKPKKPRGRSVGLEAATSFCDFECPGYEQDPKPGHYWPEEREGHVDVTEAV